MLKKRYSLTKISIIKGAGFVLDRVEEVIKSF